MTEYERGRRDAVRDVILYLKAEQSRFYESEPEHWFVQKRCEEIERLTATKPNGDGCEWSDYAWQGIECPACAAAIGKSCRDTIHDARERDPHDARIRTAIDRVRRGGEG